MSRNISNGIITNSKSKGGERVLGIRKCKHCNEHQMLNDLASRFRKLEAENRKLKEQLKKKRSEGESERV